MKIYFDIGKNEVLRVVLYKSAIELAEKSRKEEAASVDTEKPGIA
ncbi:hypothetical protein ACG2F4_09760 [Halalkalibaculum sp. DA3122]